MVTPHRYRQTIIDHLGTAKDRTRLGRPKTERVKRSTEIIRKRVERDAKRSMRKMAKELGISRPSVQRIVHANLKSRPYKLRKGHGLTDVHKLKRLQRCKLLMARAVRKEHLTTVYSDEKLFSVEAVFNSQNNRVVAQSLQQANARGRTISRVSHPKSVMVWAGVCATGKTPLVFVKPGVKINKEFYIKEILEKRLLPWSRSHFKGRRWTFQQDSAPAHSAKVTQTWCATHLPDFIPHDEWPPCSPDLNPLDFCVWAVLEREACSIRHKNLDSLKKALVEAWNKIDIPYLRRTIDSIPRRLKDVIAA